MRESMRNTTSMDGPKGSPPSYPGGQVVRSSTYIKPQARKLHDPDVTVEEYLWYAARTREEQRTLESPKMPWRMMISGKSTHNANSESNGEATDAKHSHDVNLSNPAQRLEISDEEWTNASRAFRTASWGAAFYLVRRATLFHPWEPSLTLIRSPPTS